MSFASRVATPVGTPGKRDLPFWEVAREVAYGLAEEYVLVRLQDCNLQHVALLKQCVLAGGGEYRVGEMLFVQMSIVQGGVPYVSDGAHIRSLAIRE